MNALVENAAALMAPGKGLLAMDESIGTCNKRFANAGTAQTEQMRHAYREMLATTSGLGKYISGAILHEETLSQTLLDGTPLVAVLESAGIIPGIKVDMGTVDLVRHGGDRVTEGIDGLRERLQAYRAKGARFAKWRAVFSTGPNQPSLTCIEVNAHLLALLRSPLSGGLACSCRGAEVLMEGSHDLDTCQRVTEQVLHAVFAQIFSQGVQLEGMLLKPNMVLPGIECPVQASIDEAVKATLACLFRTVPPAVAGVAFLSGGQPDGLATKRLNAMHTQSHGPQSLFLNRQLPWPLTFSFARALQQPALLAWAGIAENCNAAQQALLHRARCNAAAAEGRYTAEMEV